MLLIPQIQDDSYHHRPSIPPLFIKREDRGQNEGWGNSLLTLSWWVQICTPLRFFAEKKRKIRRPKACDGLTFSFYPIYTLKIQGSWIKTRENIDVAVFTRFSIQTAEF